MKWLFSLITVVSLSACFELPSSPLGVPSDAPRDPTVPVQNPPPAAPDPDFLRWWRVQQYRFELSAKPPATALRVPVQGVSVRRIANTFGSPRDGERSHEGIDIFAPAGTPVVSATGGIVAHVGTNNLGGLVVYTLGAGDRTYYYAHLSKYGKFVAGDIIKPGDVLGYVGNTGNARGTPPHLHFGMYDSNWRAINPYSLLR